MIKILFSISTVCMICSAVHAQIKVHKVARKGILPVVIAKNSSNENPAYSIIQFEGKWMEIERRDRKNHKRVDVTDTIFLKFTPGNNVLTRNGMAMDMKGKASIQPGNELLAAADVYDIISLNKDQVILDDRDKFVHILKREDRFWYEVLPSLAVTPAKYSDPVKVSTSNMIGNWMVYRRDAEPGSVSNDAYLIKSINIKRSDGNMAWGTVGFFHHDKTDSMACVISVSEKSFDIATKEHNWSMLMYKANGDEMVFGKPELKYYCKLY